MAENFYSEAIELVNLLTNHRGRLQENEAKFVSDLHDKLEQYGERTFLSEKQMHWLRALAKTHVPDPRQMSFL